MWSTSLEKFVWLLIMVPGGCGSDESAMSHKPCIRTSNERIYSQSDIGVILQLRMLWVRMPDQDGLIFNHSFQTDCSLLLLFDCSAAPSEHNSMTTVHHGHGSCDRLDCSSLFGVWRKV